jgi:peptidylprolyl isomerase
MTSISKIIIGVLAVILVFGAIIAGAHFLSNKKTAESITNDQNNQMTSEETKNTAAHETAATNPNWETTPGLYAKIETSKGTMVASLFYDKTPVTVANFVGLAEGKIKNTASALGVPYYDSLTFHRTIRDFMIQGGDPQGTGVGGPGYKFGDEIDEGLAFNKAGLLAMANSGKNTNGSQFFITEAPTEWLTGKHTIFGELVEGLPVVSTIENGEVMTKVSIIRIGEKAKAFDAAAEFTKGKELLEKKQEDADALLRMSAAEVARTKYPDAKKTASGLYYVITKEGTGPQAAAGNTVYVDYTGTLVSGKKFDSSYDRGTPIDFTLGHGEVIAGWDEGLALLKKGAKATFIIPSSLAYGASGAGPVIPPGATLIFDVELVDVQ